LAAPLKEGDPILSGPLLRYIPNWSNLWEYDRDRPSPRAWRERHDEEYVSVFREADDAQGTSVEKLEALEPRFGLYRVTAEALLALENVRIEYKPIPAIPEGHAHCGVFGINRSRAERIARTFGGRVRGPGDPEPSAVSAAEREDAPRDRWRT
jgi:hypothetical protein